MPEAKKKGGRPRKYRDADEARAAINASNRASRRRQQQARQSADHAGLQVQFDPLSILQQAGPEGDGQITAADRGIQAEGLDIPADEEQRDILEVAIRLRFLWL